MSEFSAFLPYDTFVLTRGWCSVVTALPTLGRVFNRADIAAWVGTAYLLTSTVSISALAPSTSRSVPLFPFSRPFALILLCLSKSDTHSWLQAMQPIYGRLSDIFGRKIVLLASIAIFLIGSLAAALAHVSKPIVGRKLMRPRA